MPTYAYYCDACHVDYEEFRFKYEGGPQQCPHCQAMAPLFAQKFAGCVPVGLVKGNPTTIGQQAELNAKRLGKEQMELMTEQQQGGKKELPPWRDGTLGTTKLDKPLNLNKINNIAKYVETGHG